MVESLFAVLLRLYPRAFRAEYGDTVLETLSWRAGDARRRGGWVLPWFVVREATGLVWGAVRQWVALFGGGGAKPFRQLRRQPLYALACAGTLALAVAAVGASLAVLTRAFIDPLPYADDRALVSLFTHTETWPDAPVSAHVFADLRDSAAPFVAYAPMDPTGAVFSDGRSTRSIGAIAVTPEYFETLGVRPALGRIWSEGEQDGVIVSWAFWQTSLAADAAVVGRRIDIDGVGRAVVGVMGREFIPPFWPDAALLVPLDVSGLVASTSRASMPLSLVARRANDASAEQVAAFLATFEARERRDHPTEHGKQGWHAVPLRTFLVGDARPALLGMGAAAGLLLLIVGANIAGLSAARALAERQQLAVRLALGATPGRLLRERLLDGLALSSIGAAVGLWLAWSLVAAVAAAQPDFMDRMPPVALDRWTALSTFAIGVGWGMLASLLADGAAVLARPTTLLGARGTTGGIRLTTLRSGLVVLQVAMALVLVVGAGLLVRTLRNLTDAPLGFDPHGLVTMSVAMPLDRYAEPAAQIEFERTVAERLENLPNVTAATASIGVPVIGGSRAGVRVFGRTDEAARGEVAYFSIAPDFIDVTGMRLIEGREFSPSDRVGGPGAIIINESAARRFWPDGGALGARVRVGPDTDDNEWITVVGIVSDIRQHGPTEQVLPTMFGSTWQYSWPTRWFTVRASPATADLPDLMRAVAADIDAGAPVSTVAFVDDMISGRMARQRLALLTLGFYGTVSVVLCAFGVYAVVTLASRLRRREYAIRVAIGARGRSVRWMVLRHAALLAGTGVAAGLTVAVAGTRVLAGLLHGVAPTDHLTFLVATGGVLGLALASAWWPAHRAGRVDPAEALKV